MECFMSMAAVRRTCSQVLSKLCPTSVKSLVGFYGSGYGRLEIEGIAHLSGAPLVRIAQTC